MIVFLHGVPETPAVWDPLRAVLLERGVPSEALELPGFAAAPPTDFTGTKEWYARWLVGTLEERGEPVHLVSHDWGSPLTLWVAAHRPDLLRSWVADATYMLHKDYRWHTLARVWQKPLAANAFWLVYLSSPATLVAAPYRRFGLSSADAKTIARMGNPTMARSIGRLYRSALPNIHATWGDLSGARTVPGLVVDAAGDEFGTAEHARDIARRLGARVEHYPDLGHWWALQAPERAAASLQSFWQSVT